MGGWVGEGASESCSEVGTAELLPKAPSLVASQEAPYASSPPPLGVKLAKHPSGSENWPRGSAA